MAAKQRTPLSFSPRPAAVATVRGSLGEPTCFQGMAGLPVAERLALLEGIFHSAPVGLCLIDLDHRYVSVNPCFARMYGQPVEFFVGRTVHEALPAIADQIITQLDRSLATDSLIENDFIVTALSSPEEGETAERIYHRSTQPMRNQDGIIVGLSVALADITERHQAAAALGESEEHLRYAVDLNPNVPWNLDQQGNIVDLSPRFASMTGIANLTVEAWLDAIAPDHADQALAEWQHAVATSTPLDQTYRMRCAGGEWRWVRARAFPRVAPDGSVFRWYGTLEDIHERKLLDEALRLKTVRLEEMSAQLALLVCEDHLTGLANRRHFDEALERESARARRSHLPLALIMIDIDHFKRYNDTYGHPAGDECIRAVAQALGKVLRCHGDLAARYGGEEFVILLPDTSEESALEVARRATAAVTGLAILHVGSSTGKLTISAGVAMAQPVAYINGPSDPLELIQTADLALYAAKTSGRNQVVSYQDMQAQTAAEPSAPKETGSLLNIRRLPVTPR